MYIYIFRSKLFQGLDQKRVVITNWPVQDKQLLERVVNEDNNYTSDNLWLLTELNGPSKL